MSRTTAPDCGLFIGKDPDHAAAALDLFVETLERIGTPDLAPVDSGERTKGQHFLFGTHHQCGSLAEALGEHVGHVIPLGRDLLGAHLGKDRPEGSGDPLLVALSDVGQQVAGDVDPTALVARPLETAPDGSHQTGALVRDDQAHAGEPPAFDRTQELTPEGLVFGVADLDAQDLPPPVFGDPGGDHHGLGRPLVVTAHVQVRGVEPDVGETEVILRRPRNAPTASSRQAQMRLTSDFEIPALEPMASTRSSTARVETPWTPASMTTA